MPEMAASIHYTTFKKYTAHDQEWQSYKKGQKMPIGGYYFRVTNVGLRRGYFDEFVDVFDDPTEKTLFQPPN